jgi:hypothetical protein
LTSGAAQSAFSLLGRLDGRGEERVELAALELLPVLSDRESEEDLAAAVVRDRAGAGEPEPGAPRNTLERARGHRRIGGDDDDAAPGGSLPSAVLLQEPADRHTRNR